jgi:hypothetical protein
MSPERCTEARELALAELSLAASSVGRERSTFREDGSCEFRFFSGSNDLLAHALVNTDDSVEVL